MSNPTPEFERLLGDLNSLRVINSRQPLLNRAIIMALGLVLIAVMVIAIRGENQARSLREAATQRDQVIAAIQQDLKGVCRAVPTPSLSPDSKSACSRAERDALPPVTGEPGRPPSADEIRTAVDTYMSAHPAPGPTPADVVAAVATYLVAHPLEPGRPPTVDEISAAVLSYCNPTASVSPCVGSKGDKGETGEKGPPPTAAEIQAALVQYVHDNPDVVCPHGGTVQELRLRTADGGTADTWQCVVSVTSVPATSSSPPLITVR